MVSDVGDSEIPLALDSDTHAYAILLMVVVVVQMSDLTSACLTGYGKNRKKQIQGDNFFLCFKLMLKRTYFWFHLSTLHFAPKRKLTEKAVNFSTATQGIFS